MTRLPVIDRETFNTYAGRSLPRHVSYPMPNWWRGFTASEAADLRRSVAESRPRRGLSLYLHLPFCEAMCKFCGCNRTILRKRQKGAPQRAERYLRALELEIDERGLEMQADTEPALVRQIHWGGGTPTYLDCEQIERIHRATANAFRIADDAEISIEVDPRVTTEQQLRLLCELGFNRVSMGVQDFDPHVQKHIHRVQPFEVVEATVDASRRAGFPSVNFDLIYGLPYQTVESVTDTIEKTLQLSPDRVAFYHYAQIPEKIANQRGIHHDMMPDSDTKLTMMLTAMELLGEAGYEFVGLDHFAKPDEMLAEARSDGSINRNFQGMTTGAELDLVGMGCSAISQFCERGFLQNIREPDAYAEVIESGSDPVIRGLELSADDCIRQRVINALYCFGEVVPDRIEAQFGIDFESYFESERDRLARLEADGLVELPEDGRIALTNPLGRILMRNVAAVFDAYLQPDAYLLGEEHAFSTSA